MLNDLNPSFDPLIVESGRKLFTQTCEFMLGVLELAQMPDPNIPEITFCRAVETSGSRASSTRSSDKKSPRAHVPSRLDARREINFFNLGHRLTLTDLPGYGFAPGRRKIRCSCGTDFHPENI